MYRGSLAGPLDERIAPCLMPGCREFVRVPDGAGRLPMFHADTCRKRFRGWRERLETEAEQADQRLASAPGDTAAARQARSDLARIRWHLARFPAVPSAD
jgi:hypothetical protein